jgi:hypothetical protein
MSLELLIQIDSVNDIRIVLDKCSVKKIGHQDRIITHLLTLKQRELKLCTTLEDNIFSESLDIDRDLLTDL